MKYTRIVLMIVAVVLSFQPIFSQPEKQPVYVIVHGAWGGGWAFKNVDSMLTVTGSLVYRPTLTGQGERSHLATLDVGLDTHINDVVNTILYEELENVILVGHSYGGMVVTGVADSIPERIAKLVYVDAFVPEDMESLQMITGGEIRFKVVNGYVVPPWVPEGKLPPRDVPHPLKTLTDKISLKNPDRMKIPTTYIITVEKGQERDQDGFAAQAERAETYGWPVLQLQADHNPQWSAPVEFVEMLIEVNESRE